MTTANPTRYRMPPLSDAMRQVLSLSTDQASDLKALELLIQKDAGACAKILASANHASYASVAGAADSLMKALQRLGAQQALAVLTSHWLVDSISVTEDCRSARAWLSRHALASWATVQRLCGHVVHPDVAQLTLMLATFLAALGPVMALTSEAPASDRVSALRLVQQDFHTLHLTPEVKHLTAVSEELAIQWGLAQGILDILQELQAQGAQQPLSDSAQLILLSELALHLKAHEKYLTPEEESYRDIAYESWPRARELMDRRLALEALAVLPCRGQR